MLWSMVSQRVGHSLETEQQQIYLFTFSTFHVFFTKSVLSPGSYSAFSFRSFLVLAFIFRSLIHLNKTGVGDIFNNLERAVESLLHLVDLRVKDGLFACTETLIIILNIVFKLYCMGLILVKYYLSTVKEH